MDNDKSNQPITGAPRTAERPPASARRPPAAPDYGELLDSLRRLEALVQELGSHVETQVREGHHRSFSAGRLFGALAQALVLVFMVAAASDWVSEADVGRQLVKLAFAAVLQLIALTAFVVARDRS